MATASGPHARVVVVGAGLAAASAAQALRDGGHDGPLTLVGREPHAPHLRTADPAILAAGDVAIAFDTALGRRLRVEHWDNAVRQGRLAAAVILGGDDAYDWQPYFCTDQFDFGMEYVGSSAPGDEVVVRGSLEQGAFIAYWLGGDPAAPTLTAAMNVNIWEVNDALRAMVGTRVRREDLTDLGGR